MSAPWQSALSRWLTAGLIDASTAERIRGWEAEHGERAGRSRLAMIAFGLGGLLLIAGVLLFVAAHWDDLAPSSRFLLVLAMIGVFHVGGTLAAHSNPGLATTLHAVGTGALGAGIYLAGQIFNIAEHWPGALMLWSIGAVVGLVLLRDWPHVLWVAVLVPAWLWGEWIEPLPIEDYWSWVTPAATGVFLLAFVYLMATFSETAPLWRRALSRLGAVALIPAAVLLGIGNDVYTDITIHLPASVSTAAMAIAWVVAIGLPSGLAYGLRRKQAVFVLVALAWALVVGRVDASSDAGELALYALFAAGAVGIVLWGLKDQQRLSVNLGVLGFAMAVAGFYFSSVFDKLGRSIGLIGIGVIFIGGGWLLEQTRRRLLDHIQRGAA